MQSRKGGNNHGKNKYSQNSSVNMNQKVLKTLLLLGIPVMSALLIATIYTMNPWLAVAGLVISVLGVIGSLKLR
jgi:membrane protein YdbS with pleckstrin-like domain